jgi:hypothetical protein
LDRVTVRLLIVVLAVLGSVAAPGTRAANPRFEPIDRNLYEWCAVAPIVASAEHVEFDGRWAQLDVERSLRGNLAPGTRIRVDRRTANRNRGSQALPTDFDPETRYVLLLTPSRRGKPDDLPAFDLVRGVRGVRELPAEGSDAILDALSEFIAIQDLNDFGSVWTRSRELLGSRNPIILETILEQYAKFRRGAPDLLPVIGPLLDHPRSSIRTKTAWLIGQILEELGSENDPEAKPMLPPLIGMARRDPVVEVRVAATEALGMLQGPSTRTVLEEIAEDDPDQAVRYIAERILLDRRSAGAETASRSD